MPEKLVLFMYQSWADLDRAVDGLTPEEATARYDGGSFWPRTKSGSRSDHLVRDSRTSSPGVSWPGKNAKSLSTASVVIPRAVGQVTTGKGSTVYFAFHALNPPASATAL